MQVIAGARINDIEGQFGNVVLVMLFDFLKIYVGEKVCENIYNVV